MMWYKVGNCRWGIPMSSICRIVCLLTFVLPLLAFGADKASTGERHYLYVAAPGIRDYLEFGGAGVLVFDMDDGHKFVRRIETPESRAAKPNNMKGICANASTRRLYFTTTKKLHCLDLLSDRTL